MRKIGYIAITALFMVMFGIIGCDDSTTDSDESVLKGEWTMNNMVQSSVYLAAEDAATQQLGFAIGDTVGAGALNWQAFQALGVQATVTLATDEFTLSGNLPVAGDTLGKAPQVVPLNDNGTWSANEALTTFMLDGGLYDFSGSLTVDDQDNPTTMSVNYSEVDTSLAKVVEAGGRYYDVVVDEHSNTTLGFEK